MEHRALGKSELVVSVVGLGCNNFGGRLDFGRTRAVVEAALDAGITFFDTADVYGERGRSERFLGEILEGRRERVYHRPDGVTPLAETLDAMDELVREGKTRVIGCSNLSAAELREAGEHGRTSGGPHIAALQNRYSLLEPGAEHDVLPLCREYGIGFVPTSPSQAGS